MLFLNCNHVFYLPSSFHGQEQRPMEFIIVIATRQHPNAYSRDPKELEVPDTHRIERQEDAFCSETPAHWKRGPRSRARGPPLELRTRNLSKIIHLLSWLKSRTRAELVYRIWPQVNFTSLEQLINNSHSRSHFAFRSKEISYQIGSD